MGKLVDELLAYLSKASKEQLVKDWEELKEFNEVVLRLQVLLSNL